MIEGMPRESARETTGAYATTGTDLDHYGNCTGPVTFYAIYYQSDYYYTGAPQTFTAPVDGWYRFTLYGASGGYTTEGEFYGNYGGLGGKVAGKIYLSAGTRFYVYVGGAGSPDPAMGWNGGAAPEESYGGGGGGATDIRLENNTSLSGRIAVAGGGGGSDDANFQNDGYGGAGGGLEGGRGGGERPEQGGQGGSQTNGYQKGYGMPGINQDGGGGGGGYWGGIAANHNNGGGGGGSSYMSGMPGCETHYSGYVFEEAATESGVWTGSGKVTVIRISD